MWGGYLESASCPKQMFKTSTSLFPKMCFPGLLSPPESNESNDLLSWGNEYTVQRFYPRLPLFSAQTCPGQRQGRGSVAMFVAMWSLEPRGSQRLYPLPVPVLVGTPKCRSFGWRMCCSKFR